MSDPVVGGLIAGVGSLLSTVVGSLMSPKMSMPSLQMPQVQQFTIPEADMQALNAQIQQNTQLSDQAREAAQKAIYGYQQGQLSGAYAGQYQQAYNQMRQQLMQQLAAQGFGPDSQQYINAMQQLEQNAAALKSSLLQKQLEDGLKLAGLSDTAIKDYESKWATQNQINSSNNAANIGAANAYNSAQISKSQLGLEQAQLQDQTNKGIAEGLNTGLQNLKGAFGGGSNTGKTTNDIAGSNIGLLGKGTYNPYGSYSLINKDNLWG